MVFEGFGTNEGTSRMTHMKHGNTKENEQAYWQGAKALETLQRNRKTENKDDGTRDIKIRLSNITSIHSKAAEVAKQSLGGYHAIVETKADIGTMNRVNAEMGAHASNKSFKGLVRVVWGQAMHANTAGLAMVESPEANGTTQKLEAPGEKQRKWRQRGRLEVFRIAA